MVKVSAVKIFGQKRSVLECLLAQRAVTYTYSCVLPAALTLQRYRKEKALKGLVRKKPTQLCSWLFKKSKQHMLASKSPCSKNNTGQRTPATQFLQQPCIWNRSHCAREGLEREWQENTSGSPEHRHWQDTWRDGATEVGTGRGTASQSAGPKAGQTHLKCQPAVPTTCLWGGMALMITDFSLPLALVR